MSSKPSKTSAQSLEQQKKTRNASRPSRHRGRGCLLFLFATVLAVTMVGILAYALLRVPSPTNILVLGIDRRPGQGNAVRTDTMLLVHSDPSNRRLVLLSIPRDLWVTIPGRGTGRINAAHVYAEIDTPGSGPASAAETVSQNFGVPVDRTLRLDFDAFRDMVDAAGGIDVDVPKAVIDNAYPTDDYGTIRIEIPAGQQHMDGEIALQYVRSRHGSNDFDRAARQQQILLALAKKLSQPGGWALIPRVYLAFRDAVDTDLTVRDFGRLLLAWRLASKDGLETIVIDGTLTTPYRTDQGASVLLPRWELIQPLVQAELSP